MPEVAWLTIAPVKGLALAHRDEIVLEKSGVLENRRFHLADESGRLVNGMRHSTLFQVQAEYDAPADRLELRFPDGSSVDGDVKLGEEITTWIGRRPVKGRVVVGPWAPALSEFGGKTYTLVQSEKPGAANDRSRGPVSMVSEESVHELGRHAGRENVDARRFRMLIGLRGCRPHEEDEWLGQNVRVGEALVHVVEQVARCAITTKDPDTGRRDLDTLGVIKEYRGLRDGKELDFGVYGEVVSPGRVRVGDPVHLL